MRMGPNRRPRMRRSSAAVAWESVVVGRPSLSPADGGTACGCGVRAALPNPRVSLPISFAQITLNFFRRLVSSARRTKFGSKTSARKPASVRIQCDKPRVSVTLSTAFLIQFAERSGPPNETTRRNRPDLLLIDLSTARGWRCGYARALGAAPHRSRLSKAPAVLGTLAPRQRERCFSATAEASAVARGSEGRSVW